MTVVGARPQFIKAAPMSRALRRAGFSEFLLHTGQHYDPDMSGRFFDELGIPSPDLNLDVGSGSHALQTARMMTGVEEALLAQKPDAVILYGDTNSTLAGALAAAKLQVPIAHVEAGLRSFDRSMPEEINRIVTDRLASLLWAPGQIAVDNLRAEGVTSGVELVGDVMADALQATTARSDGDGVRARFGLRERGYAVATIHRAANTEVAPLQSIVAALGRLAEIVVWPVHPRMRAQLEALHIEPAPNVRMVAPLGHFEMIALVRGARIVLTDSGGLQKEAYWLEVPCVTLRDTTEWVETVAAGWNTLVGSDTEKIVEAAARAAAGRNHPMLYGDGQTAERCVASLARACDRWAATRDR